jgi:Tfp pilus assembly protein PilN
VNPSQNAAEQQHTASAYTCTAPAALTEAQALQAFTAWNTEHRESPADFLTQEEQDRMACADLSQQQAIYFIGLLRKIDTANKGEVVS